MTTVRPQKGAPMKKMPENSNSNSPSPARRPAWGQNRASPSPGPAFSPRGPANGFPPLGQQANGKGNTAWATTEEKERLLANMAGSINSTVIVSLRTNTRYEGVLTAVSPSATDDASITLKNAKDLSVPGAPSKDIMKIPASNVLNFSPGPVSSGGTNKGADAFRTDSEISRAPQGKRERELQAWQADAPTDGPSALNLSLNGGNGGAVRGDDVTFGPGANQGASWDQFQANEQLFGVKTHFNEDEYTTKLDRSGKDFKEREKRAEQIAAEIIGSNTSNPHVAEERGQAVDDSGANEEDKYGAVVRGANAYIPPGARRVGVANSGANPRPLVPSTPSAPTSKEGDKDNKDKPDVPKVSVNAPDGSEKSLPRTSPSPAQGASALPAKQQPADALPAFRDFVTNEKQRLTQKKQALVKNEMEKRVAELVKFSQSFKLNKPIPEDLVPILAKDEEKQKLIREKATKDSQAHNARSIGISSTLLTTSQTQSKVAPTGTLAKPSDISRKPSVPTGSVAAASKAAANVPVSKSSNAVGTVFSGSSSAAPASSAAGSSSANGTGKVESSKSAPRIGMVIQPIPPFRGRKTTTSPGDSKPASNASNTPLQPLSPTAAQRLNVNASSFRPNPKAAAFTPTGPSSTGPTSTSTAAPKPKAEAAPSTPNPFFGTQIIKKLPAVNVKDDFNPFKYAKVSEASSISPNWPYSGKRYIQMFPTPQVPPQASPHMTPHHPPPPPPSYDEDAAAQAAATRGYVYAYAPYGYGAQYPPQPMMPGMPGMPPGAFVPGPYMQPMPYPPNMPPPNGQPMYAPPPMGQMQPPQQYMPPPPPPGAYPPPPASGGPRPSMPPTPIPAHAHPYYQSPQLQHAMPYQMMIPPPGPPGPPHPYEAGPPPVPMGGVGHA